MIHQQGKAMSQELFFVIAAYYPEGTPNRPEGIIGYLMPDFCRCLDLDDPCIYVAETFDEAQLKLAEFKMLGRKLDTNVCPELEHHKVIRVHRNHLEMQ